MLFRSLGHLLIASSLLRFTGMAQAQVQQPGYVLPLALAQEASNEALGVCRQNGYPVTVTVVDVSGASVSASAAPSPT